MNPQFNSAGGSVDKPCFTLIARMDKMPPYLIEASREGDLPSFIKMFSGGLVYEIYDTDTDVMKKNKGIHGHVRNFRYKNENANDSRVETYYGIPGRLYANRNKSRTEKSI